MSLNDEAVVVYDAVIIGGGPSGLACALTLGRVRRSVVVLDSQQYRNEAADHMHAFPTNDGRPSAAYLAAARNEVQQYPSVHLPARPIAIVAVSNEPLSPTSPLSDFSTPQVTNAESKNDSARLFRVTDAVGHSWVARFLVLATGVIDILPSILDFETHWGRSILHCIYCHGYEHRDQSAGVIGGDFANVSAALTSATLFSSITLFCNDEFPGTGPAAQILQQRIPGFEKLLAAKNVAIDRRTIKALTKISSPGLTPQMELLFSDGSAARCDILLHVPPTTQRADNLGEQLGLAKAADGSWELSHPSGKTNVDRVYATGDAAQVFKSVSNAVLTGMAAGTMVHHELSFHF